MCLCLCDQGLLSLSPTISISQRNITLKTRAGMGEMAQTGWQEELAGKPKGQREG
jgi:hypothetical protein